VGPIKTMIRSLDLGQAAAYLRSVLHLPVASLRSPLRAFARDHEVAL
jgi:phosphotransferase system enzyme I (PtsP)